MTCSQCGRDIPSGAVFCAYCGASTTLTASAGAIRESSARVAVSIQATTRGKRFINLVIDTIALQVVVTVLRMFGLTEIFYALGLGHWVLGWIVVPFLYYTLFEGALHKTPGKYITKTHVVTADGGTVQWSHSAIRSLLRFIPFEAFSFLFRPRPAGWHDRFAKTMVVDD